MEKEALIKNLREILSNIQTKPEDAIAQLNYVISRLGKAKEYEKKFCECSNQTLSSGLGLRGHYCLSCGEDVKK